MHTHTHICTPALCCHNKQRGGWPAEVGGVPGISCLCVKTVSCCLSNRLIVQLGRLPGNSAERWGRPHHGMETLCLKRMFFLMYIFASPLAHRRKLQNNTIVSIVLELLWRQAANKEEILVGVKAAAGRRRLENSWTLSCWMIAQWELGRGRVAPCSLIQHPHKRWVE